MRQKETERNDLNIQLKLIYKPVHRNDIRYCFVLLKFIGCED